jgi:O-antigen ligase
VGRGDRFARSALLLLPGALVVFMGFNAGGNFPIAPAVAAIVLVQLLLLRVIYARDPFEGLTRTTLVAIAALALYGALTLVSALWSHSLGRALIEFDRIWLYLVVLLLLGSVRPRASELSLAVKGLLVGIAVVCLAGLASRLLPDVWHTAPDVSNERLSFPVTYWNALGLLAVIGVLLAFHLTCSLVERRIVRVLAAALVPLLAATLFFTFSRGAMAAGAVGLLVYAFVGRPRGLLSGSIACAPSTAIVVVFAYHANLLDTIDPTTPGAVAQGHRVALVGVICALAGAAVRLALAVRLDPWLRRAPARAPRLSRASRRALIVCAACAAALALLVAGAPHAVSHEWQRFASGATPHGNHGDFRERLADPANNGRTDLWRVALHGFEASPVHGAGTGLYETIWDAHRPTSMNVVDAHSLYLQAAAELGVPGLLLVLALVGAVLVGLALRAQGSQRSLYGVLLAVGAVWALHAGVDWDWEMPVVTLVFFSIAGLALAPRRTRRAGGGRHWVPKAPARAAIAALCLASVVLPVLIIGSQSRLDAAEHDLYASNCNSAGAAARSSLSWIGVRAQPSEIIGFCDLIRGRPQPGVRAMQQAHRADPESWEPYYGLALARAAAGLDPRADAATALRLNPRERLTRRAAAQLRGGSRADWISRAPALRAEALASNDLSIVPS